MTIPHIPLALSFAGTLAAGRVRLGAWEAL
jgi:hypothetical protein